MFLQFALLFCYVNSFTQFQKNTNNYRIKSTILSSSLKPNTFSFSETSSPPKGQDIDANQQDGLEILLPNADTVEMTNAELRQEWKNILEELKQSTTLPFYLRNVLPAFYSDQAVFKLKSSDDDKPVVDQNELYLTEVELRRLWQEMSFKSFGKPITKFNVLDSLLLLPDEEEEDVMGEDTLYDISLQMNYLDSNTNKQSLALDSVVESVDPFEYVFTTEELQRAWNERAEVSWGLPAKSFSEQAALLLLSEDDDDELYEDDAESLLGGSSSRIEFVSVLENDVDETDESGFWNNIEGDDEVHQQQSRDSLRNIHRYLEDPAADLGMGKQRDPSLTPDVESQNFMGDLMQGNSYLTQRIPSNWRDPEADVMSDTYRMTDVMALPDEPLLDYTIKTNIWDRLQVPLTPKKIAAAVLGSGDLSGLPLPELDKDEEDAAVAAAKIASLDSTPPDWSTFDFSSMEALPETFDDVDDPDGERKTGLESSTLTRTKISQQSTDEIDVDKFFDNIADGTSLDFLDGVSSAISARAKTPEELEDEYDFQDDYAEAIELNLTPQMRASKLQNSTRALVCKNFRTPPEWLSNQEFANHVGFDEWSQYSPEAFDDSSWQWEDLATVLSTEHLLKITDLYLQDHKELKHKADMRKYWTRLLNAKLSGQNITKEPIPLYLTPDIDRGVTYSDELIEMKSKLVLQTYQPPPRIMFANDSFTPNEELETLNRIGTIRDQYDWSPSVLPEECQIDDSIEAKIAPVLRFINHAAELKSTKGNVLIFDYKTSLRHIIGARDMMYGIAKTCFPELVDIRLETSRKNDSEDS